MGGVESCLAPPHTGDASRQRIDAADRQHTDDAAHSQQTAAGAAPLQPDAHRGKLRRLPLTVELRGAPAVSVLERSDQFYSSGGRSLELRKKVCNGVYALRTNAKGELDHGAVVYQHVADADCLLFRTRRLIDHHKARLDPQYTPAAGFEWFVGTEEAFRYRYGVAEAGRAELAAWGSLDAPSAHRLPTQRNKAVAAISAAATGTLWLHAQWPDDIVLPWLPRAHRVATLERAARLVPGDVPTDELLAWRAFTIQRFSAARTTIKKGKGNDVVVQLYGGRKDNVAVQLAATSAWSDPSLSDELDLALASYGGERRNSGILGSRDTLTSSGRFVLMPSITVLRSQRQEGRAGGGGATRRTYVENVPR